MGTHLLVKYEINEIINRNCFKLTQKNSIYHGNLMKIHDPKIWPQFFGPKESAQWYIDENKGNRYVLHRYIPLRQLNMLNFTPSDVHSKDISRLLGLIDTLIKLTPDMTSQQREKQRDNLAVVTLFTHVIFGLDVDYDRQRLKYIVEDLGNKLTYNKKDKSIITEYNIESLLSIIDSQTCTRGRMSISTLDKMYFNAFAFLVHACQLPIDGVYFSNDVVNDKKQCCHRINDELFTGGKGNTCVPPEYIILRPNETVKWVPPTRRW